MTNNEPDIEKGVLLGIVNNIHYTTNYNTPIKSYIFYQNQKEYPMPIEYLILFTFKSSGTITFITKFTGTHSTHIHSFTFLFLLPHFLFQSSFFLSFFFSLPSYFSPIFLLNTHIYIVVYLKLITTTTFLPSCIINIIITTIFFC